MSQATADIVVNTGDLIQFMFTPMTGGVTKLIGASLTVVATNAYFALPVSSNKVSIANPPGTPASDSILQLALLLGPNLETGTVSYSIGGGVVTNFYVNRPFYNPIIEIDLYGK